MLFDVPKIIYQGFCRIVDNKDRFTEGQLLQVDCSAFCCQVIFLDTIFADQINLTGYAKPNELSEIFFSTFEATRREGLLSPGCFTENSWFYTDRVYIISQNCIADGTPSSTSHYHSFLYLGKGLTLSKIGRGIVVVSVLDLKSIFLPKFIYSFPIPPSTKAVNKKIKKFFCNET